MTDTTIYFGTPGSLVELPHPRNGLMSSRLRDRAVYRTAAGGVRFSQMVGGKRLYALSWQSLPESDFATVLAYDQGHMGPGPFALLDPGQRNQLTANQSSATSEVNDTDNFTVSGSGYSLSSDSTTYYRGPRSLKLTIAYASQGGSVTLDSPSPYWTGVPVTQRAYTFSVQVKGAGADPVVTLTPKLTWYTAAGATVSTDSGNATASTSADWTQLTVTATAPSTAAYVLASVETSASSIGAASVLYLDNFQLEEGASVSAWCPGTGVVPVVVVSLPEQWPWQGQDFRVAPILTLQEVGP